MVVDRTDFVRVADLLVELRRDAAEPLHRQIAAAVRQHIRAGRLARGATLPPTRLIAAELGVSRGVVVEAYAQLTAEGYLTARSGGYTEVAHAPVDVTPRAAATPAPPYLVDFAYGRADVAHFPRTQWLRSIRTVLTDAPNGHFALLTGRGAPRLRSALAGYLNRVRGTDAHPDNIVITNGWAQGIRLLIQVLSDAGATTLAMEDPAPDDDARPAARRAGMTLHGVPVDDRGLCVDALTGLYADALVLAPSHQWPVGGALPADRRAAVLHWAARRGALVIEDDYDAEYRFDRSPVGALQGLAPHQVVYAGTLSKTLAPGVRIGWLVLPPRLADAVATEKMSSDRGSAAIEQLAFADFLDRGEFDRHLRRMRPIYRARRQTLIDALARYLPGLRPAGVAAGLHLLAWLPRDLDEAEVVGRAAAAGVHVAGVSRYRITSTGPGGLIFGYSALSEPAIVEGIRTIAQALR